MEKDKIRVTLPESVMKIYDNFERIPTVTGAFDCMICDTRIHIYDNAVPSVPICDECKRRLKDLLYKESEDE